MSVPLALAFRFGFYHIAVRRLRRTADTETMSLILFFGLSQVLEAAAALAFGSNQVTLSPSTFGGPVHLFGQSYPPSAVVCGLLSVPMLGVLFFYLYRTRLGLATRAVMADEEEATASGVRVQFVAMSAFAIGIAFAAAAGPLAVFMLSGINPATGGSLTVTAFTVIVIGSLGNPAGTAVRGLLYGVALGFTDTYASAWAGLVPFALLLVVMLLRPSGLFGRTLRSA